LALHFSTHKQEQINDDNINDDNKVKIYLLCRSEEKAKEAMADINIGISTNNLLEYMKFDANDDGKTIEENIRRSLPPPEDGVILGGIILNAGGFGDGNNSNNDKSNDEDNDDDDDDSRRCHRRRDCSKVAQLNIIGHAALINHLLSMYKIDDNNNTTTRTRIVAVGSEASFASPGVTMDYTTANFVEHLSGTVAYMDRSFGVDYGWIKGILALYWAAFARHHPELYVVTVSPGAVSNTKLFSHGGVSPFLRGVARLSQVCLCVCE